MIRAKIPRIILRHSDALEPKQTKNSGSLPRLCIRTTLESLPVKHVVLVYSRVPGQGRLRETTYDPGILTRQRCMSVLGVLFPGTNDVRPSSPYPSSTWYYYGLKNIT
jgi:hypothetical protein